MENNDKEENLFNKAEMQFTKEWCNAIRITYLVC
jgi:hypothetical protein